MALVAQRTDAIVLVSTGNDDAHNTYYGNINQDVFGSGYGASSPTLAIHPSIGCPGQWFADMVGCVPTLSAAIAAQMTWVNAFMMRVLAPGPNDPSYLPVFLVEDWGANYTKYVSAHYIQQATNIDLVGAPPPNCSSPSAPRIGDPIDVSSGNSFQTESDSTVAQGSLGFRRYYNSVGTGTEGFGTAWSHSFSRRLELPDSGPVTSLAFVDDDGRRIRFSLVNGVWQGPVVVRERLQSTPTGWILYRTDNGIDVFDAAGKLVEAVLASGYRVSVGRDPQGRIGTVTDSFGRSFTLGYGGDGQVASLFDARGATVTYRYEYLAGTTIRLTGADYQDLTTHRYTYSSDPLFPFGMVGLIDESSVAYMNWSFDRYGRAFASFGPAGVGSTSVVYGGTTIQVTDALSTQSTLTLQFASGGLGLLSARSQAAGSGCSASSSSTVIDGAGNVTQRDDFNGHRVCFAYDTARGLQTARVEGLDTNAICSSYLPSGTLPTGARRVSTDWHPDWRLPRKIAEPGRLTTLVYNGQPDPFNNGATLNCPGNGVTLPTLPDGKPPALLCKKVEQATSDTNGSQGLSAAIDTTVAARRWSYTYNPYGQILVETDPLNHPTSYAYYSGSSFTGTDPDAVGHTAGDLQTVTNALNQAVQNTKYDKAGFLKESIDPNGVVTSYVYDARQRLTSRSVGGQATLYEYWPTGLLKKVTQPDTVTFVQYTYDDAHRLYSVQDNLGNSVTYTLDNAGNRKLEQIKDPASALRRQLSRDIDALNRVQQLTGTQ